MVADFERSMIRMNASLDIVEVKRMSKYYAQFDPAFNVEIAPHFEQIIKKLEERQNAD